MLCHVTTQRNKNLKLDGEIQECAKYNETTRIVTRVKLRLY